MARGAPGKVVCIRPRYSVNKEKTRTCGDAGFFKTEVQRFPTAE
jgi:hypothetical protein